MNQLCGYSPNVTEVFDILVKRHVGVPFVPSKPHPTTLISVIELKSSSSFDVAIVVEVFKDAANNGTCDGKTI